MSFILNMQIIFKKQMLRIHNKVKSKLTEITRPLRSHTKAAPKMVWYAGSWFSSTVSYAKNLKIYVFDEFFWILRRGRDTMKYVLDKV